MRQIEAYEYSTVSGGNMGNVAVGLTAGAAVAGTAAAVTRFIPGAQVVSAALTVVTWGLGALAGAAAAASRAAPAPSPGSGANASASSPGGMLEQQGYKPEKIGN
jgi:hypothetical protein